MAKQGQGSEAVRDRPAHRLGSSPTPHPSPEPARSVTRPRLTGHRGPSVQSRVCGPLPLSTRPERLLFTVGKPRPRGAGRGQGPRPPPGTSQKRPPKPRRARRRPAQPSPARLPAHRRPGVLLRAGGGRGLPGRRKRQGACALGPLPSRRPRSGSEAGPGRGLCFPACPAGGRAGAVGAWPRRAGRSAGRPGRGGRAARAAAAPERVERSGAPGGGGGGGGAEEQGGGGPGPGPRGSPPPGARPGPSHDARGGPAAQRAPRPRLGAPPPPPPPPAAMARPLVPSSQKALLLELKGLQEEPVEGFRVTLVDEGDLYNWEVAIFGPPNTYYEGGYFKARLKFPIDYPYSPPAFRFLTKMWHPNIYETGDVCISILHPPVDDPQSGELPSERWNPTQNVRTILLSVISLLNEPNTFSPANVDASVMYRKWKESKGKDREYTDIIRKQVLGTKVDAERDGVKVPTTLAEYCVKTKAPAPDEGSDLFYDDYYEDGEAEGEADSCFGDEDDDSGTEES
ncbi:LOW QUALITY PROTEIN: ubiquitin-conjugating enzyme E2 R1 [Choloepus didactylus]|uniref:LOW QUALITY PROTEIN: ubiquitin-conjugating enzyme E2 R1 n=1 Tax=Choloepus didactylus TaxID=27675 RepID=UPI00189EF1F1|nr:LOW QUALITY PROTEIN: ubiquitin-conjugating enzyme E2 R1 [Choloepus didactylus]